MDLNDLYKEYGEDVLARFEDAYEAIKAMQILVPGNYSKILEYFDISLKMNKISMNDARRIITKAIDKGIPIIVHVNGGVLLDGIIGAIGLAIYFIYEFITSPLLFLREEEI